MKGRRKSRATSSRPRLSLEQSTYEGVVAAHLLVPPHTLVLLRILAFLCVPKTRTYHSLIKAEFEIPKLVIAAPRERGWSDSQSSSEKLFIRSIAGGDQRGIYAMLRAFSVALMKGTLFFAKLC